jgi:flagellar motility protein MotE (MotC chaperone)
VSKKRIIITAAVGLISFAGAFLFAWLTKPAPQDTGGVPDEPVLADYENELALPQPKASAATSVGLADSRTRGAMTDKQLKGLIYEVREKILEYDGKLEGLQVREKRLQVAQQMLKKDIDELNNLRVELASVVAGLKEQQELLRKSRLEVAEAEKSNLISMAAAYDKMDPASAGKILTNMSRMQDGRLGGNNLDDAVKILHYMSERTKAKLLAELVGSEPKLAAVFCQRLKQIVEEK